MFKRMSLGFLSAFAVAASVLLIRGQKAPESRQAQADVPAGESVPGQISLEKLRELGI